MARALRWAAVGLAGGLLLAIVAPFAFGARPYTVLSGSMEPAISAGDLVIAQRVSPSRVGIGDVVTFEDPGRGDRLTTHRVGGVWRDGDKVEFVTKGDANDATERWRVDAYGQLGRVAYAVPWVGHVAVLAGRPLGFALLVVLPLLLLAINELMRIWRPSTREVRGEASA